jgi:L-fucose mutarotase
MPLFNIPEVINPEFLYSLAKMGHGDTLVIADSNFPSDSIAKCSSITQPIRVNGKTTFILGEILKLFPLDQYSIFPVAVMDRVKSDKERNLQVPTYEEIVTVAKISPNQIQYVERYEFYERARSSFCIIQTDDKSLYANIIITKGVIS